MDAGESQLAANISTHYFPGKLWHLVNNPANEAIYWDSLGKVIIIDQKLFEGQILSPSSSPSNLSTTSSTTTTTIISSTTTTISSSTSHKADTFRTTNFNSFVRQLNLYGFRKPNLAVIARIHPAGVTGHFRHFYHSNFKRNHPELVATLRRLTVNNKARLQAGLTVRSRPLSGHREGCGATRKDGKKVTSLPGPMNQEPTHPYNPHTGTPAPPQHPSRALDIGAPLPAGIVFPSHGYTRVSSTSDAMHLQGDFMACVNHGNPDFTTYNAQAAQYLPGFNPPFYEYYQPHHAASHMTENGLLTWSPRPHGYFQVADKVMQAPPSRVMSSEKPVHVSELSPSTSYTILSSSSASTMTANPQTIIKDKNSNADGSTYSEQEVSVVSVTEHMPEDVINAVTIVDANGNEFVVVKVEDIHFDLSQVKDISYR